MKPIESLPLPKRDRHDLPYTAPAFITKLNELIQAHNELLAKYEGHTHHVGIMQSTKPKYLEEAK